MRYEEPEDSEKDVAPVEKKDFVFIRRFYDRMKNKRNREYLLQRAAAALPASGYLQELSSIISFIIQNEGHQKTRR